MQITVLQKCHTPAIQAMTQAMLAEGKYADQRYDADRVADYVNSFIEDEYRTRAFYIAVSSGGDVAGMFVAELGLYPFRHGLCVNEIAYYVKPQYRGSSAAIRLILRMQEWAKDRGADEFLAGITAPHDGTPAERVYERMGFTKWGIVLRKEL